mmetsp:Transcript_18577/g.31226  ORF Transcript_18577/g.31226 Transcript_18577/m.31226 type:complete len:215 (-) Transcript_18577:1870-2514(-)
MDPISNKSSCDLMFRSPVRSRGSSEGGVMCPRDLTPTGVPTPGVLVPGDRSPYVGLFCTCTPPKLSISISSLGDLRNAGRITSSSTGSLCRFSQTSSAAPVPFANPLLGFRFPNTLSSGAGSAFPRLTSDATRFASLASDLVDLSSSYPLFRSKGQNFCCFAHRKYTTTPIRQYRIERSMRGFPPEMNQLSLVTKQYVNPKRFTITGSGYHGHR